MTAYPIRAAAALGSVLVSLTIFHGVASLAALRHPVANSQVLAAQTPAVTGGQATALQP